MTYQCVLRRFVAIVKPKLSLGKQVDFYGYGKSPTEAIKDAYDHVLKDVQENPELNITDFLFDLGIYECSNRDQLLDLLHDNISQLDDDKIEKLIEISAEMIP